MQCRISANLITLNEERNIAACLESLRWADEIVVVDGGSQDRTVELAQRFTGNVTVHSFHDFASQRNLALDRSHGDWIFSIDADERVTPALAREIQMEAKLAPAGCSGFWVPIRSLIFHRRFRHSGVQSERKMRLFRRSAGRWEGSLHEKVRLDGFARRLRNAIEHYSTASVDAYLHKLMRYSSIEADRMMASGRRPSWWRAWAGPAWTFVRRYFGGLGLLDGPEGFRFAILSAWESWISHQKFLERSIERARQGVVAKTASMPLKEEWHERTPVGI